jgi:hypothetical protein
VPECLGLVNIDNGFVILCLWRSSCRVARLVIETECITNNRRQLTNITATDRMIDYRRNPAADHAADA